MPRLLAAVRVEHFTDVQAGAGGDALLLAVRGGAGAGDGGGDVRAMAYVVREVLGGHEVGRVGDAVRQVRVAGVHAGVQHGDVDALTGVAGRPHLRGADLGGGVGQSGLDLPVQPHLGDATGERGLGGGACGILRAAGEPGPEVGGVVVALGQCGALDAAEGADLCDSGGKRLGAGGGAAGIGDEQREMVGVRVIVAVGEELGDVEQPLVQAPGGDVRQGGVGVGVGVFPNLVDLEPDGFTVRSLDLLGRGAVGGGGDGDLVSGDQGDGASGARTGTGGGVR
jgi:hypothetical protein